MNLYTVADKLKIKFELKKKEEDLLWINSLLDTYEIGLKDRTALDRDVTLTLAYIIALKVLDKDMPCTFFYDEKDLLHHSDLETLCLMAELLFPTAIVDKYKLLLGRFFNLKPEDIAETYSVSVELVTAKLQNVGLLE